MQVRGALSNERGMDRSRSHAPASAERPEWAKALPGLAAAAVIGLALTIALVQFALWARREGGQEALLPASIVGMGAVGLIATGFSWLALRSPFSRRAERGDVYPADRRVLGLIYAGSVAAGVLMVAIGAALWARI